MRVLGGGWRRDLPGLWREFPAAQWKAPNLHASLSVVASLVCDVWRGFLVAAAREFGSVLFEVVRQHSVGAARRRP
jgi:hypothetical protein